MTRLDEEHVSTLRQMANGMRYRSEASKRELVRWLRDQRPEVEGPACSDPYPGTPYEAICGRCTQPIINHEVHL
jgi:hypothetical protein